MKIIFDLDGTLLDSQARLYNLFQHLVPGSRLSFDEYWVLKKGKISHGELLKQRFKYSEEDLQVFQKDWLSKIEKPEWLAYDHPFDGLTEYLSGLKKKHRLFVVTARQHEEVAVAQIEGFGWGGLFEEILITRQQREKTELLKSTGLHFTENDWIVGDTGKDIETGKSLGIKTCAVLSGFLSRESLLPYMPDMIAEKVTDISFPA